MTDSPEEMREQATGATAVQIRAADWILARRTGAAWNAKDQTALDAWLAEARVNRLAYLRLDAAWARTRRLAALRRPAREWPLQTMRRIRPLAIRGAAALAVIALCVGGVYEIATAPGGTAYATAIGGHRILKLPDGSLIELNTDTVVRVAANGDARRVWLSKGEAYFQIKHDPAHPFTVIVGNHTITDLGTKFLVDRQAGRVSVSVVEGKARVETKPLLGPAQSADLTAGEVAMVSSQALSVSRKPMAALKQELGWRRGVLIFHDTPLARAAAEFNRYNAAKIVIPDSEIGNLTVDGTFPAERIQTFAQVARDVLRLHVKTQGNTIVITR